MTLIVTGSIGAPPIAEERLPTFDDGTAVGLPSSSCKSITVFAGKIERIASSTPVAKSLMWTLFGAL